MTITFPSNTVDTIDAIRDAIGREVTFYTVTLSGCSVCSLDPYTNTSTDSYCPTCSGLYWIPVYSGVVKTAHVTWKPGDILNWQTGGYLFDGDCRVQIKLESGTEAMLDSTEYVLVDDRKLEIKSKIFRGVPELNRVLLDCIEKEK